MSRACLGEILNRAPDRHAPYVGPSAFAHKGGLHSSAVAKDPRTYEHVPPEVIGNARKILVSDQAGRSNLLARLAEVGIDLDAAKDARVSAACSKRSRAASFSVMPMTGPRLRSSCSPGARSARCPIISRSRISASRSSAAAMRSAGL